MSASGSSSPNSSELKKVNAACSSVEDWVVGDGLLGACITTPPPSPKTLLFGNKKGRHARTRACCPSAPVAVRRGGRNEGAGKREPRRTRRRAARHYKDRKQPAARRRPATLGTAFLRCALQRPA